MCTLYSGSGDSVTLFCAVSFTLHGRISCLFLSFCTSPPPRCVFRRGCKRDHIPNGGGALSPSRGEAIRPKPPNDECRLPPSWSGRSLWAAVGVSNLRRHTLGWGSPLRTHTAELQGLGIMRRCGEEQRHLPVLLVTFQVCVWNSQPQIHYIASKFGQWCCWLANYRYGNGAKVVCFIECAWLVHKEQ